MAGKNNRAVAIWLLCGCFMVFLMVIVGGITRLTGSGLSITEWNLVVGTIPPMNEKQWEEAFDKYKQIPQFQKLNYDFNLQDFKRIFFWEYLHRLLGRLIGVVFVIPFLFFLSKKMLSPEWIRKSLLLFALGALQGFLGWFMVKSGLSERTSVSHYRLAIHLLAAFITFGFTFWFAMQLLYPGYRGISNNALKRILKSIAALLVIQVVYGAFVAGLHAGKIANTFPTMDGEWVPGGLTDMEPGWINLFENMVTVQFIHRCIAWTLLVLIAVLWWKSRNETLSEFQARSIRLCFAAVCVQFLIGVFTLLFHVPIVLGTLHQVGGFILFAAVLVALFSFSKTKLTAD